MLLWHVQVVEDEQQEVMEMGDRQYRKFARDCARTRAEVARAAEKARADKAAERAQDVKRFKGIMQVCWAVVGGVVAGCSRL